MSAAAMAAEIGASVKLFEAEGVLGGSTKRSSGMISAAGTSVQKALGVEDSVERTEVLYGASRSRAVRPRSSGSGAA